MPTRRKIHFVEAEQEAEALFSEGATSLIGERIAARVRGTNGPAPDPSAARVAEFSWLVNHSHLIQRQDVVLTPHVAFNSEEAVACLCQTTIQNIRNYLDGNPVAFVCS